MERKNRRGGRRAKNGTVGKNYPCVTWELRDGEVARFPERDPIENGWGRLPAKSF